MESYYVIKFMYLLALLSIICYCIIKKRIDIKLSLMAIFNHNGIYPIYSKKNLKPDSILTKYDTNSNKNNQLEPLNNEIILEPTNIQDDIDSKNDRIFCPFCGRKNIINANFCHYCGKDMRMDTRGYNRDFREYREQYFNTKAGILKYSGLFQILIGLHGLLLITLGVLLIFDKGSVSDVFSGLLIFSISTYIFYQYFKYKKRWTYYIFLVFFGFLCILSFFAMFQEPFVLIVFILYCLILWYLYESLKSNY